MPRGSSPERERQYEHTTSDDARGVPEGRAQERGGEKSRGGASERTEDGLCQEAGKRGVEGRSTLTKQQLKNLGH